MVKLTFIGVVLVTFLSLLTITDLAKMKSLASDLILAIGTSSTWLRFLLEHMVTSQSLVITPVMETLISPCSDQEKVLGTFVAKPAVSLGVKQATSLFLLIGSKKVK